MGDVGSHNACVRQSLGRDGIGIQSALGFTNRLAWSNRGYMVILADGKCPHE